MTPAQEKIKKALLDLVAIKDASIFQDVDKFSRLMGEKTGLPENSDLAALRFGLSDLVPWELRKLIGISPVRPSIQVLADKLAKKHQIPPETAFWAIETWAGSVGLILEPSPKPPVTPARPTEPPKGVQPGKPTAAPTLKSGGGAPQATPTSVSREIPEPKSRFGIVYGIDEGEGIKVFKAWWKQASPQETAGMQAAMVKPVFPESRPFTGVSQTGTAKKDARNAIVAKKTPTVQGQSTSTKATSGSPVVANLRSAAATASLPPKTAPGKQPLLTGLANESFGSAADQFYKHAIDLLEKPIGRPNMQEIVKTLVDAAKLGHLAAEYRIGEIYLRGIYVKEDWPAAFKWFDSAAKKGFGDAQMQLGSMYQCGIGIEANLKEAQKWLEYAAAQGNQEARKLLSQLKEGSA